MKFFNFTPKQQIIVSGIVLGVVIIFILIFLVIPSITRMGALMVQREQALKDFEASKSELTQLEEIKRSSQQTENSLLQVSRQVPFDAELSSLLVQMEDISLKAGIDFTSIKPSSPVQKEGYAEIPLEIKIEGYFYELLDFIYRLEKLPRLVCVNTIEIKEGSEGLPQIEVAIKANAFILTPGKKATKGAAAGAEKGAPGGTTPAGKEAPGGAPAQKAM